ncbi:unnamed protein product, partial [Choristocarpus tenellus]
MAKCHKLRKSSMQGGTHISSRQGKALAAARIQAMYRGTRTRNRVVRSALVAYEEACERIGQESGVPLSYCFDPELIPLWIRKKMSFASSVVMSPINGNTTSSENGTDDEVCITPGSPFVTSREEWDIRKSKDLNDFLEDLTYSDGDAEDDRARSTDHTAPSKDNAGLSFPQPGVDAACTPHGGSCREDDCVCPHNIESAGYTSNSDELGNSLRNTCASSPSLGVLEVRPRHVDHDLEISGSPQPSVSSSAEGLLRGEFIRVSESFSCGPVERSSTFLLEHPGSVEMEAVLGKGLETETEIGAWPGGVRGKGEEGCNSGVVGALGDAGASMVIGPRGLAITADSSLGSQHRGLEAMHDG